MNLAQVPRPLTFEPLFFERVWGGRKLQSLYGKAIPPDKLIGESWELVDRAEAQSIVREGEWRGRSLHDLWVNERAAVFGNVAGSARFPLLIKLLDCRERLSLQVHPPASVASKLGGEPKTECWYIAEADNGAELYLGWREPSSPNQFQRALTDGSAEDLIHHVHVNRDDTFFIPSGRIHAIGGGNLIVEVQQNSDTTYRVFDWNRRDQNGAARQLHVEQALACIDFDDYKPGPVNSSAETLITDELFQLDRWSLDQSHRELSPRGNFAIALCLRGAARCGSVELKAGQLLLLPALANERDVLATTAAADLLKITIPRS